MGRMAISFVASSCIGLAPGRPAGGCFAVFVPFKNWCIGVTPGPEENGEYMFLFFFSSCIRIIPGQERENRGGVLCCLGGHRARSRFYDDCLAVTPRLLHPNPPRPAGRVLEVDNFPRKKFRNRRFWNVLVANFRTDQKKYLVHCVFRRIVKFPVTKCTILHKLQGALPTLGVTPRVAASGWLWQMADRACSGS